MPTKADLEEENGKLAAQLKRAKNALKKAKKEVAAEVADDTELSVAATDLCDQIRKRGLDTQVGQKQLRHVVELLGTRAYTTSWREAPTPDEGNGEGD